jgi:hypothetical protein
VFTPRLPLHAITHRPLRRLIHLADEGHTLVDLGQPRKQRRTPTQLHTRLMWHLHNLKPRRRTLEAVFSRPTHLTLNLERLPTQRAISLHHQGLSLPIVAPLDRTPGREDYWGAGHKSSISKNSGPGFPMLKPWSWCWTPRLVPLLLDHPIGNEREDEEQAQQKQNQQDHHRTVTRSLLRNISYYPDARSSTTAVTLPGHWEMRCGAQAVPRRYTSGRRRRSTSSNASAGDLLCRLRNCLFVCLR